MYALISPCGIIEFCLLLFMNSDESKERENAFFFNFFFIESEIVKHLSIIIGHLAIGKTEHNIVIVQN